VDRRPCGLGRVEECRTLQREGALSQDLSARCVGAGLALGSAGALVVIVGGGPDGAGPADRAASECSSQDLSLSGQGERGPDGQPHRGL
jgi:hypothetical protein